MANTLTGLIPTIYTALDEISRELIGFIPNVSVDAKASRAAVGQTVTAPVVPQGVLEDIVPGVEPASSGDQDIGNTQVTITKSKAYPIRWTGEEQLQIGENGQYNRVLADQFSQGFRTLSNAVESDLASLYSKTARAVGTAGTTPFGTVNNHTDWANANKTLDQLGAPQQGRIMVVGSEARSKIEGIQSGLFHVNQAGDGGDLLRNRQMRQIHRFTMGFSEGINEHTAGTGASYVTNGTFSAGEVEIAVDTGTGTIVAGDVLVFEDDPTQYVVATALAGGTVTIAAPGLKTALADGKTATVQAASTANMFFHRNSLLLAARAPASPIGGDSAEDTMIVSDPVSGLSFEVSLYKQYKQIKYEIGLAWGVAAPNGKHAGVLLG